ncbi:MAG: hypothetical protein JSS49_17315 [Planctomycetes bacterium]|nr:hypothetical protein [Planctomycetota bacterium]
MLNNRHYHRCPLPDARPAVLVVDRHNIDCWVFDMSLGGFGVLVAEPIPVMHEPLARLQVQGLTYIVRVTRQEIREDEVLLALERIDEIVPDPATIPATPLGRCLTGAAWIAAICIVVAAVCLLADSQSGSLVLQNR